MLSVSTVETVNPRACVVRLALGSTSFEYRAGQAVFVRRIFADARPLYSIATSPGESAESGSIELLVRTHERTDGTAALPFRRGEAVEVDGPTGSLALTSNASVRLVFIAGGVGIAPIRALLHEAIEHGHGDLALAYSGRTPADLAYGEEFRRLCRAGRLDLTETVTRHGADDWTGACGRFGAAALAPLVKGQEGEYFVCGPPGFVLDLATHLETLGVPLARIHTDLRLDTASAAARLCAMPSAGTQSCTR